MLYSPFVEQALRFAAKKHGTQVRKGTEVPYLTHLASVTLILARAGFDDEEVLAAALLHDALEDADVTADEIIERFGRRVAELVAVASEIKCDASGAKRPWRSRKEEHLARVTGESVEGRAIVLADKLHNLGTLLDDLAGDPAEVWSRFNSSPEEQFWYYKSVYDAIGEATPLLPLRAEYGVLLERLRATIPPS